MKRAWPLVLIPILVVWLAAPREVALPPGSGPVVDASASSEGLPLGAPSVLATRPTSEASLAPVGTAERTAAPTGSGGIGQPASYCKPGYCETPQPVAEDGIVGEATWWNSFGSGIYTALRPDLGSKGDLVIVCGPLAHTQNGTSPRAATSRERARETPLLTLPTVRGSRDVAGGLVPFHCRTAPVITSCACLGPHSNRLVDLSLDLFREFADPSRGVVRITLQVVGR